MSVEPDGTGHSCTTVGQSSRQHSLVTAPTQDSRVSQKLLPHTPTALTAELLPPSMLVSSSAVTGAPPLLLDDEFAATTNVTVTLPDVAMRRRRDDDVAPTTWRCNTQDTPQCAQAVTMERCAEQLSA